MVRLLSPGVHGALDYGLAVAFLFVPGVLGFDYAAANLAQVFGVTYLAASLLTRYPLGAVHLLPFPLHGVLEALMAASWVALPWVFGFTGDAAARTFFVVAGLFLLAVVLITDYRGRAGYVGAERRRNLVDRRQRALAVEGERRTGLRDRRVIET